MNIIMLNGKEEGRQIQASPGVYRIGRSPRSDIIITDDKYVSSSHAELNITATGSMTLTDLKSRNGTFLLGEPVTEKVKVNPGDILRVGRTFLKVSRRSAERFFPQEEHPSESPEAVVVVDIVGSSKIAQALGDRMASKVKNELAKNLQSLLAAYPEEFMKNTGDGYMLVFANPMDSIRFSQELMQTLTGDGSYRGFHVRIGIHYGETFRLFDGDRRGMTVDMAFRVESVKIDNMHQTVVGIRRDDMPRVDRIFITEVVNNLIPSHSKIKTRCIGFFDLKGFTGRHKLFEVLF